MEESELKNVEILNDFDYSNCIAEVESILFLVQYCDSCYKKFEKICEEDEEKNHKLKIEFKDYQYKKIIRDGFEVIISGNYKALSRLSCKSYETFIETVNSGNLKNINSLKIVLDLSYKRGKYMEMEEYENIFNISFKPYEIVFTRKSNHDDEIMNQIEDSINDILKKFRVANTIFCTK